MSMESTPQAAELLAFTSGNAQRYRRNFLRQAVCELRFPILMELAGPKPPAKVVAALRKNYPHIEVKNELTFNISSKAETDNVHVFRSQKLNWSLSVRQSALAIETTRYTDFVEMLERTMELVNAAKDLLDTDFFTRVGLRYVNVIDVADGDYKGWISDQLAAPLFGGQFKGIAEQAGKLALQAEDGGCLLQHGVRVTPGRVTPKNEKSPPATEYVVDIDVYRNEVPIEGLQGVLESINHQGFSLFDWAIGEKARKYLSE